jgi:hypothetical protein
LWVIEIDAFVGLDRLIGLSSEISFGVRMISEFIQATSRLAEERVVQILDADWSGLFGTARKADWLYLQLNT